MVTDPQIPWIFQPREENIHISPPEKGLGDEETGGVGEQAVEREVENIKLLVKKPKLRRPPPVSASVSVSSFSIFSFFFHLKRFHRSCRWRMHFVVVDSDGRPGRRTGATPPSTIALEGEREGTAPLVLGMRERWRERGGGRWRERECRWSVGKDDGRRVSEFQFVSSVLSSVCLS